jgi:tRNA(adenine34) deaminase
MNDSYYMQVAISEAKKGFVKNEVPVGAVCVIDNEIISQNHNQVITTSDASAHAEVLVLRETMKKIGNYRLPSAQLYITKEPCCMCCGLIIHARIKRVIIGTMDKKYGAALSVFNLLNNNILNHKPELVCNIMAEETKSLLQNFFQQKRKKQRK